MVRVLFVCTGNICRSSMAEGLFRHAVREENLEDLVECDSAGLIDFHAGDPPDSRAQQQMLTHGVDISDLRSRPVSLADLSVFEYIVAMDRGHYRALQQLGNESMASQIALMMDYSPGADHSEVPDPYYGEASGFVEVAEMLKPAIRGLIQTIRTGRQPSDR